MFWSVPLQKKPPFLKTIPYPFSPSKEKRISWNLVNALRNKYVGSTISLKVAKSKLVLEFAICNFRPKWIDQ